MNLDPIRQKIESGSLGFVASIVGFASVFLALLPNAFQSASNAPRWENLGAIWYCAMVGILCVGCITGVIFSLYALCVRRTRHAWFGLLIGLFGVLYVPTYLLPIFRWLRGI
jgi:hypothetical protein